MPASNQTNIFVVYVNIQYNLYNIFINIYKYIFWDLQFNILVHCIIQ